AEGSAMDFAPPSDFLVFSEPRYFVFFAIVFGGYWLLRADRPRKLWLLAASYYFYATWDWRFLALIWISTAVDYVAGRMMSREPPPLGRKFWLVFSLVANLGILGVFKYFNFFIGPLAGTTWEIILPAGISFYTFQTLSYTIDVYRGVLRPVESVLDFALFVAFFPQLVAGPVVRASVFLPQLDSPRRFAWINVRRCLALFVFGFIKKECISDHVAEWVEPVFARPEVYTVSAIWLAVLFYAVQIYCDFSGYTDMALASAGLLGYELQMNFAFPYFAPNVQEFWGRWHISLSTWLRDYLYIPLGGNRGGGLFTFRNLMITMLLGGLWHGAGWNFILWGGLHGLALAAHRLWKDRIGPATLAGRASHALGPLVTFYWVCLMWILFRAQGFDRPETLDVAFERLGVLLEGFVLFQSDGGRYPIAAFQQWLWLFFAALAVVHWLTYRLPVFRWIDAMPGWLFYLLLGVWSGAAISFADTEHEAFIYFQF
ncbi:MAG: MBOAT family O-acyltransferase, partial [Planctomycetaceae bacterium]